MAEPDSVDSTPEKFPSRFRRLSQFAQRHLIELGFVLFVLGFISVFQFIDTGNLSRFLLAASYLSGGKNPYSIFPFPPPPGMFLFILPTFAVYLASGHSLFAASAALKVVNIAALLATSELLRRITILIGGGSKIARRLGIAVLTSPLIFFISFVWVEQDIVGIALTLAGLYVVLREERGENRPWIAASGFGLLAFATFFYYFPALILFNLLVFSRTRNEIVQRATWTVAILAAFGLWFLFLPGWNFLTNSTGLTGLTSVSVFSVLTLLQPALFSPSTVAQQQCAAVFAALFIALELVVPVLLRWRGFSLFVSLAIAITLPLLFLNILNGDEFAWPLPFLMLGLVSISTESLRGIRLRLIEAYAIPMVVVMNFFDSPGPGAGTGIFYLSYPQFHDGVSIWNLFPQFVVITQVSAVLLWGGLAGLSLYVVFSARVGRADRPRPLPKPVAGSASRSDRSAREGVHPFNLRRGQRMTFGLRRWPILLGVAASCIVITAASVFVPVPSLTSEASQAFPVAFFSYYPVANASVTYALTDDGRAVSIAPNYGNPAVLSEPWRIVSFGRNLTSTGLNLSLDLAPVSPPGFAYNTTVLSLGNSDVNLVRPFVPPDSSELLSTVVSQNLSPIESVASPQFSPPRPSGFSLNGSAYAEYNVTHWLDSGGNLTVYFNPARLGGESNVVATLFTGNITYQLAGSGDIYFAAVKPSTTVSWVFTPVQLVNPTSWHSLTITADSHRVSLELDGIGLPLPTMTVGPGTAGVLDLGNAGPLNSPGAQGVAFEDLYTVYNGRPDLQSEFPRAFAEYASFVDLVNWAGRIVTSSFNDSSYAALAPFGYWYALMLTYNERPDLQVAYPNAYTNFSSYLALLDWADRVATSAISDSSYPVLRSFASSYVLLATSGARPDLQAAFVGTLVGPAYAVGSSPSLSNLTLCGFEPGSAVNATCVPFNSPELHVDCSSGGALMVVVPTGSISLRSHSEDFELGRLSAVGPGLLLQAVDLSITSTTPLLFLVWVIDGAIVAPVLLVLCIVPPERKLARTR